MAKVVWKTKDEKRANILLDGRPPFMNRVQISEVGAELHQVIDAWPELQRETQVVIMHLIES
jgi:hypothetical protein